MGSVIEALEFSDKIGYWDKKEMPILQKTIKVLEAGFSNIYYMEMATQIAESNICEITNQGVGCVIVKNGEIVGTGCRKIYRNFCGKIHKCIHAEHMALMEAGLVKANRATLYATMEPCAKRWYNSISWHLPCCCDLIYKYGISKVVIGSYDERFGRGGKEKLEELGIEVELCLNYQDRIDAICKNAKVDPQVQKEYEKFTDPNIMSR